MDKAVFQTFLLLYTHRGYFDQWVLRTSVPFFRATCLHWAPDYIGVPNCVQPVYIWAPVYNRVPDFCAQWSPDHRIRRVPRTTVYFFHFEHQGFLQTLCKITEHFKWFPSPVFWNYVQTWSGHLLHMFCLPRIMAVRSMSSSFWKMFRDSCIHCFTSVKLTLGKTESDGVYIHCGQECMLFWYSEHC